MSSSELVYPISASAKSSSAFISLYALRVMPGGFPDSEFGFAGKHLDSLKLVSRDIVCNAVKLQRNKIHIVSARSVARGFARVP